MPKRGLSKFALIIGFIALLYALGFVVAINSAAYVAAVEFVKHDQVIAAKVGKVRDASLSFLNAQLRFAGHSGDADFVIIATTEKGQAHRFRVRLENSIAGWKVVTWTELD